MGHEDWVHSVAWQPPRSRGPAGGPAEQPLCVLSASMDRTMMMWRPDPAQGTSRLNVGLGHWRGVFTFACGHGSGYHEQCKVC